MQDLEAIEMMERSSDEIKRLRAENNRLQPLAEGFEVVKSIFRILPGQDAGHSDDVAWLLDRRIRELKLAATQEKEGQDQ